MTDTPTKFDYKRVPLNQLKVELEPIEEISAAERQTNQGGDCLFSGGRMVKSVIIDDEPLKPTGRFWSSLYSKFNLNRSFFKFFDHEEVFKRIAEVDDNPAVRVCIERSPGGDGQLLAATGTNKPVIIYDQLIELLHQFRLESDIGYSNGCVTTTHTPRVGASEFKIGADKFSNKFVLNAPIDGFGKPNIYLSLLRWVCSNGMVGWAKAFKTTLQLGTGSDNVSYTLKRALEGFTNDEGFATMRQRFEIAQNSWASVREREELYRTLIRLQNDPMLKKGTGFDKIGSGRALSNIKKEDWMKGHGAAILKVFGKVSGDPYELYYQDPHAMSHKRQRTLPTACKVYDLLNFATEVATHHVSENGARSLQGWVGEMLSKDYDLEDSCDHFNDFRQMFLEKQKPKA